MAAFTLIHHTTWEEAQKIVAQYPGAFVSIRQHVWQGHKEVQPIVKRVKTEKNWINYHKDDTFSKTLILKRGKLCFSYAPYYPCPSMLVYDEFAAYCYNELLPMKGKFETYLRYFTDTGEAVMYCVETGKMLCDIEVPMGGNPMLFFSDGGPKFVPKRTGGYGGDGSRERNRQNRKGKEEVFIIDDDD